MILRALAWRVARWSAGMWVVLSAAGTPAWAHALGGADATNYETRVLAVEPAVPGLDVGVVDAGSRLQLSNATGRDIVVLGYEGEPYLRIGPGGVFENRRSPAVYANRDPSGTAPVPPEADPLAPPEWRQVRATPSYAWHDHRTHWMAPTPPPQVSEAPGQPHVILERWLVSLRDADEGIAVTGDLLWVPGPSPWPWAAAAAACLLLALAAAASPRWPGLLAGLLAVLLAVDLLHGVSAWIGTTTSPAQKISGSLLGLGWWIFGLAAIGRLVVRRRHSWGVILLLFATGSLLASKVSDIAVLWRSQLPGVLPGAVTRGLVATTLGLGAGLFAGGLVRLSRLEAETTRGTPPRTFRRSRETAVHAQP